MYDFDEITKTDPEIADAIKAEMERQNSHIELIASENWVSKAVMAAMGSPLTNNMQRDIREKDIMADVSAWMLWKILQEREQRSCSAVNMSMFSHIPVHRQIWQLCSPCLSRETRSWE